MSGWGLVLRLARRDLTRSPSRTLLTAAMVALPVLAVTGADVLIRSVDAPSGGGAREQALRELGPAAEAVVRELPDATGRVEQDAFGQSVGWSGDPVDPSTPRNGLSEAALLQALPQGSRLVPVQRGVAEVRLADGPGRARAVLADPADPLLAGTWSVTTGRLPTGPAEVAVAPKLVEAGLPLGSSTPDVDGQPLTVVGVLPAGDRFAPALLAPPGSLELAGDPGSEPRSWLVDSPAPVTWADVQELNALGAVVTSRAVLRDPPVLPAYEGGADSRYTAAILGLVTAMAVLQVVLLAGPAFAVGARRQRHALAQLVAAGGEGRDARRVVLAGAGLLGVLAAAGGIAGGVALAVLARGVVPALDPSAGLVVPVLDLVGVFAVAVGSALLAAAAPAWAVARQNPVSVLTDRRDPPRAGRLPVAAAVALLAVGVLACARAARGGDEVSVALAAVPTVLGAVLLAPAALVLAARLGRGLPFPARYAVRDAARQRGRAAPAIGAIAAVVAGAVALGVGASSDDAQRRADQQRPQAGATAGATVTGLPRDPTVVERVVDAAQRAVPEARVAAVTGLVDDELVELCPPRAAGDCSLLSSYGGSFDSWLLVGPSALEAVLPAAEVAAARAALDVGGAVVFAQDHRGDSVAVRAGTRELVAPALVLPAPTGEATVRGVLSDELAEQLGLAVRTVGISITGPLAPEQRAALEHAVDLRAPEAALTGGATAAGEDSALDVVLLLLAAVAGVLVLGGVLTSTLLALADARPEFATLHALGATARSRRLVAAGYAATVGLLGAALGAAAGLVPGVAVSYPLTRGNGDLGLLPAHLDVPWLLITALVLAVPAVAAAVAALTARGPLPPRTRPAAG